MSVFDGEATGWVEPMAERKTALAPVEVRCLGHLRVALHGHEVPLGRHARGKPVEALLRVIAAGPDGVATARLAGALRMTGPAVGKVSSLRRDLAQLRTLLAGNAPLVLDGGWVRVDPDVAWVDALALERALRQWTAPLAPVTDALESIRVLDAIFGLKNGEFLDGHAAEPWVHAARLRLEDMVDRARARARDTALAGHAKP